MRVKNCIFWNLKKLQINVWYNQLDKVSNLANTLPNIHNNTLPNIHNNRVQWTCKTNV